MEALVIEKVIVKKLSRKLQDFWRSVVVVRRRIKELCALSHNTEVVESDPMGTTKGPTV
jgi:hypothetical protein